MESADGELIRRIRESPDPAKKNAALAELLSRHREVMLRTAYAVLAGRSVNGLEPEDVVQQAIAEVLLRGKLRLYDPDRPFVPWLVAVVRNVGRDLLRDERPHAPLQEQATPARADEQASAREQVEELLAGVSEEERDLLRMFYLEELSAEEVADHLGGDAQRVYRRLHRLRCRLRSEATLGAQAD